MSDKKSNINRLSDYLFVCEDGKRVVGQAPNIPIIIVFICIGIGMVFRTGIINFISELGFIVAMSWWSWLEFADGVNRFRKLLGIAGFVLVVLAIFRLFG